MVCEEIGNKGLKFSDLQIGDFIRVDDGNHKEGKKIGFIADFDAFNDFFKSVDDAQKKFKFISANLEISNEIQKLGISKNAFVHIMAFLKVFKKFLADKKMKDEFSRQFLYAEKNPNLSEVFYANKAACVEISSLFQYYMQSKGFDVFMINGQIRKDKKDFMPENHTFNVLIEDGNWFLCDISKENLGTFEITKEQQDLLHKKMVKNTDKDSLVMLETKNFHNPNIKLWYGFGVGSSLNPSSWLSKNNIPNILQNVSREK